MKKLIKCVIFLVFMLITLVAFNLNLNEKIRLKLSTVIQRHEVISQTEGSYLMANNQLWIEDNDEILSLNQTENKQFISIDWLTPLGMTAHYDEEAGQLNIIGGEHFLEINEQQSYKDLEKWQTPPEIIIKGSDVYIDIKDLVNKLELTQIETHAYKGAFLVTDTSTMNTTIDVEKDSYLYPDLQTLELAKKHNFLSIKEWLSPIVISQKIKDNATFYYATIEDASGFVYHKNLGFGFIGSGDVVVTQSQAIDNQELQEKEPINLIWEAIYNVQPDTSQIPQMPGINVVSPTWYELENSNGDFTSKFNQDYLNWAKQNQYQVWALVTNQFDPDMTHELLGSADARQTFIEGQITEAISHGYEGINIDFENIYLEDKDALTHFINEFKWYTSAYGITLSMDVTIMGGSDNWSKCYDHEALGKIVDYLIIMTYDQYWASSPISGPVAAANWAQNALSKITNLVDPQKVVMGIPLYTRVWTETISTVTPDTNENKSSAISMTKQEEYIDNSPIAPIWDDTLKLYYISYFDEEKQIKLWIENAETINYKIEIARDLELGGIAFWRRGFESDGFWNQVDLLK